MMILVNVRNPCEIINFKTAAESKKKKKSIPRFSKKLIDFRTKKTWGILTHLDAIVQNNSSYFMDTHFQKLILFFLNPLVLKKLWLQQFFVTKLESQATPCFCSSSVHNTECWSLYHILLLVPLHSGQMRWLRSQSPADRSWTMRGILQISRSQK